MLGSSFKFCQIVTDVILVTLFVLLKSDSDAEQSHLGFVGNLFDFSAAKCDQNHTNDHYKFSPALLCYLYV
jgi:hypothetical protein